jgi:nitrate/nitrite transporter NarK
MFIKDIFFFHEHARKINIWASFIILSPYFGPLITAFIISTQKWQWAFGVYTIMTGLCLIAQILFVDETYFNRKIPASERMPRQSRLKRIIGIEQWHSRHQRSTFAQAVMRSVKVISKPTVFLSCFYYLFTFAWVVGINTTLAIFVTPLYNFGPRQIGFFYFTPVVAATLGEIIGHWLHDIIAKQLTKRNNGTFQPEFRLTAIWFSTPFIIVGLVVLGFSLQNGWHYMVTSVAWGLYVFGIMVTTVAITAYNLDSYPEGSGEVAAWINFSRTCGGFIISYFQVRWAAAQGTKVSFGIQAAVCVAVFFCIVSLQLFGQRLRRWSGPLKFKTA